MIQNQVVVEKQKAQSVQKARPMTAAGASFEHPELQAQNIIGNHGMLRLPAGEFTQTELEASSPDDAGLNAEQAVRIATSGFHGAPQPMPHHDTIQRHFGRHDISSIEAHIGGEASRACRALGADAYTSGSSVAFNEVPTLHTAAHEAAHVVQQKIGVRLTDGMGKAGDLYERHADEVANAVVLGHSCEQLLDAHVGTAGSMRTGTKLQELSLLGKEDAGEEPSPSSVRTGACSLVQIQARGAGTTGGFTTTDDPRGTTDPNSIVALKAGFDAVAHGIAWESAALDYGTCYKHAYEKHKAVLDKQESGDALAAELCFGVLSCFGGAALSGLAKLAKTATLFQNMPAWQVDGLLEVSKSAVGKAAGALAKPKVQTYTVSPDPLEFVLGLTGAVKKHFADCVAWLNLWIQTVEDDKGDPNELKEMIAKWKKTKNLFKDPPKVPVPSFTKELEIGMWAKWVQPLKRTTKVTSQGIREADDVFYYITSYTGPGNYVWEHLDTLVTDKKFEWNPRWWPDFDNQIAALVKWGEDWEKKQKKTFDL